MIVCVAGGRGEVGGSKKKLRGKRIECLVRFMEHTHTPTHTFTFPHSSPHKHPHTHTQLTLTRTRTRTTQHSRGRGGQGKSVTLVACGMLTPPKMSKLAPPQKRREKVIMAGPQFLQSRLCWGPRHYLAFGGSTV